MTTRNGFDIQYQVFSCSELGTFLAFANISGTWNKEIVI